MGHDYLLFPVLEIVHPIVEVFSLPNWTLAIFSYLVSVVAFSTPALIFRAIQRVPIRWHETIAFLFPAFVWGVCILAVSQQLPMAGVSFYFAIVGASVWWLHLIPELESESDQMKMVFTHAVFNAFVALLTAVACASGEMGGELTFAQYFANPGILVF